MNGEFVVYVNHPKKYTKIHLATCWCYIHRDPQDEKNGFWSGEVKTFKDAEDYAKSERKKKHSYCLHCKPRDAKA